MWTAYSVKNSINSACADLTRDKSIAPYEGKGELYCAYNL